MTLVKINNIEYKITEHAKYRMKKRKVKVSEVVEALTNPKFTRKSDKGDVRITVVGKNSVTVIYAEDSKAIITVYNRNKEYYISKKKQRKNKNKHKLKKSLGNRYK